MGQKKKNSDLSKRKGKERNIQREERIASTIVGKVKTMGKNEGKLGNVSGRGGEKTHKP